MLVREEVVFAAHVGHLQESQALSSERLGSPALYFPVQSDPLERGYRLCARACLITADLYTTIGMVSMSEEKGSPTSPNVPERWEYQQEKKRNERQMSKTMEHSGSEDMTSHTEQQAGPRSRHTDAAVVRLRRRKAEESGKVARNAVQRDQRSALGRSAGIASQPLFPGQTVVGTLRTGKDNRLFFGAQLGRRRGLYVHPLTAQQLSTGSPLLSARPVPRSRSAWVPPVRGWSSTLIWRGLLVW